MNVFILGAGFSNPAGLPLGDELFSEIIEHARLRGLYANILEPDIESFLEYSRRAKGRRVSEGNINFEEFISYLDIEHLLKLRGSDHWSSEGNRSQLVVRNLIALALHLQEQAVSDADFSLYEEFVERLEPGDWIFTFNYDTLVERALRKKRVPYRLYQTRFKEVSLGSGTVPEETGEIVLLKMHGSIDWFDASGYRRRSEYLRRYGHDANPHHIVFDGRKSVSIRPLVDDPYPGDSPLRSLYVIEGLGEYLSNGNFVSETPLIVSPSFSKLTYLNPLSEFWAGFSHSGVYEKRVAIIGFSLPEHDEYIRQPLYWFIRNFQRHDSPIRKKTKLKMVDFRRDRKQIAEYEERYRFVDWKRTERFFGGFSRQALDMIFSED